VPRTDSVRSVASPAAATGVAWAWPLKGSLVQTFSDGDRTRQGIRIRGRAGEQATAAADGQVVYSGGGLKGYGNLIIIKHNDKYLSAYGFNRRLLAAEGDRVKRGQAVAEIGQAVEGGGYLLHFEIRRDGAAVDPLLYLPPRT
jgi:lipoprotein NlpD